jgi:hypothetical protein
MKSRGDIDWRGRCVSWTRCKRVMEREEEGERGGGAREREAKLSGQG